MSNQDTWRMLNDDVTFFAPSISRDTTPDEFLETNERQRTILSFDHVLVGFKQFQGQGERDEWVSRYPLGKRIEVENTDSGVKKAGNIIEVRVGDAPDDLSAAILIYIERVLPPEHVADWVI